MAKRTKVVPPEEKRYRSWKRKIERNEIARRNLSYRQRETVRMSQAVVLPRAPVHDRRINEFERYPFHVLDYNYQNRAVRRANERAAQRALRRVTTTIHIT